MRYPSRFAVWSALLTFCVLFWVWVVGMLIDWLHVEVFDLKGAAGVFDVNDQVKAAAAARASFGSL